MKTVIGPKAIYILIFLMCESQAQPLYKRNAKSNSKYLRLASLAKKIQNRVKRQNRLKTESKSEHKKYTSTIGSLDKKKRLKFIKKQLSFHKNKYKYNKHQIFLNLAEEKENPQNYKDIHRELDFEGNLRSLRISNKKLWKPKLSNYKYKLDTRKRRKNRRKERAPKMGSKGVGNSQYLGVQTSGDSGGISRRERIRDRKKEEKNEEIGTNSENKTSKNNLQFLDFLISQRKKQKKQRRLKNEMHKMLERKYFQLNLGGNNSQNLKTKKKSSLNLIKDNSEYLDSNSDFAEDEQQSKKTTKHNIYREKSLEKKKRLQSSFLGSKSTNLEYSKRIKSNRKNPPKLSNELNRISRSKDQADNSNPKNMQNFNFVFGNHPSTLNYLKLKEELSKQLSNNNTLQNQNDYLKSSLMKSTKSLDLVGRSEKALQSILDANMESILKLSQASEVVLMSREETRTVYKFLFKVVHKEAVAGHFFVGIMQKNDALKSVLKKVESRHLEDVLLLIKFSNPLSLDRKFSDYDRSSEFNRFKIFLKRFQKCF